jgi:hypothetical protein
LNPFFPIFKYLTELWDYSLFPQAIFSLLFRLGMFYGMSLDSLILASFIFILLFSTNSTFLILFTVLFSLIFI